ncbi:hypothetical protein CEB3_c44060 [Peptococcaceae bacterium CEB3]|nr:hypothetical protein CEB3_c44060 [Peptococcaceae bacterium CEB3]
MWSLIGVLVVVVGFVLRINPLLVVTVAGLVTGLIARLPLDKILTQFGTSFVVNRYMSLFILILPVIGLMERYGLKEQAENLVSKVKVATTGRILILYLFLRELTSALGLTSLGGHAQMVRPLIAPMAEGAAEAKYGDLPESTRYKIRAFAASADNVGLFFGEDIFIAIGAILLMKGFFDQQHIAVTPLGMAVWGIPTALTALVVHSIRFYRLDGSLRRELTGGTGATTGDQARTATKN